jgi:hypothetical protein
MTIIQDRRRAAAHVVRALTAIGILASAAFAQAGRSEMFGLVRDPAGLPVPDARVEIEDRWNAVRQSAATGVDGAWHSFALTPGPYRITVTKTGFRTLVREGVQVRVAERIPLDLALEVGDVDQRIEVRAGAPILQAGTGTASFVVEQSSVASLPLDGRNFVPLIGLLPGVMLPPGQVLPRINGSRPRVSEYLYDGVSVLQPEPGQVAFYPIIDAIEEFRVQTNSYSAEYGRSNGGIIQVATRSGGDGFHGTLFEFLRNEALNARNFFSTTGTRPEFRRNQPTFARSAWTCCSPRIRPATSSSAACSRAVSPPTARP